MQRHAIETDLSSFSEQLWRLDEPGELIAYYKELAESFGFPVFACGELDAAHLQRSVMHVVEWPAEWFLLYIRHRLFEADPLMDFVRQGHPPFTWTERINGGGLTQQHWRLFEMARDFGWRGGLSITLPRGGTRFALLSLAGASDTHLSVAERASLIVATRLFYERYRCLQSALKVRPSHAAGLTARELDCLTYVALGLNDAAVGEKLGISRSTAHEHIEVAKRKLQSRTRTEAVGIAVALGAIVI